jgi:hypothetical protein
MEIRKAIKTKRGTVLFEGELSDEEFDFVLTVGLNELLSQGALPFHHLAYEGDAGSINVQSQEKQ